MRSSSFSKARSWPNGWSCWRPNVWSCWEPTGSCSWTWPNVSYLDRRAVRLLQELAARSVTLINCPPLVDELVREDAP